MPLIFMETIIQLFPTIDIDEPENFHKIQKSNHFDIKNKQMVEIQSRYQINLKLEL